MNTESRFVKCGACSELIDRHQQSAISFDGVTWFHGSAFYPAPKQCVCLLECFR